MTDNNDTPAAWAANLQKAVTLLTDAANMATFISAPGAPFADILDGKRAVAAMILFGHAQHGMGDPGGVTQWWHVVKKAVKGLPKADISSALSATLQSYVDGVNSSVFVRAVPVVAQDIPDWDALMGADPDGDAPGAGWLVHCLYQIARFMTDPDLLDDPPLRRLQLGLNIGRALAMTAGFPNSDDAIARLNAVVQCGDDDHSAIRAALAAIAWRGDVPGTDPVSALQNVAAVAADLSGSPDAPGAKAVADFLALAIPAVADNAYCPPSPQGPPPPPPPSF